MVSQPSFMGFLLHFCGSAGGSPALRSERIAEKPAGSRRSQKDTCLDFLCPNSLLIAASLSVLVTSAPAAHAGTASSWCLMQDSQTAGPHKTTVTPDGIVCQNQKAGIVMASRAPKWDVLVYNKKSKTYCLVPLAQFRGEMNSKLYDSDRLEMRAATWRFARTDQEPWTRTESLFDDAVG